MSRDRRPDRASADSASAKALDSGRVVSSHGRHEVVETPDGQRVLCHPRGKNSGYITVNGDTQGRTTRLHN